MPRIVIDDLEIEVPPGTKVIEAAEKLGIMIPRFCYHEAMGSVGACRMCAVKFLQGPVKGVQMSCMVDAQDGMVVSTTDEEAVAFRRQVIEWLMLNHPHDCPVCDEGGQCLLQDETISSGHSIRRYAGKKRTYINQYLGAFIAHEMNRCIHCYRCSRFYQVFSGYRDLGPMQIGNRVYFGRFTDGQLESPFSGNLVDICATGVYTDKPARFKVRRWDLERSPSVCVHCSLGCNTIANARYRAVMRIEARVNQVVNGHFICDLGRFSFAYANHPERPRRARIESQDASWSNALQAAATKLARISADSGPKTIASLASARASLETQGTLAHLSRTLGWREPDFFTDRSAAAKAKAAVSRLSDTVAVSMREVERGDFILIIGADPVNEAPMLAYAVRQAFRNEAPVVVIDPRPVFLPMEYEHFPVTPKYLEAYLGAFIRTAISRDDAASAGDEGAKFFESLPTDFPSGGLGQDRIAGLADKLGKSKRPVIICGTSVVEETTPAFSAACAQLLHASREGTGIFYVLPGPNAFGAALLDSSEQSFNGTIEAIEKGTVKALIVIESDPFWSFPDRKRLENALEKLELLLVLDYLPSETARRANILLPTQTVFEAGATLINQEGRVQYAQKVYCGGIPFSQVSGGAHPPREYGIGVPGADPKPAWETLADIARALPEAVRDEQVMGSPASLMARAHPSFTLFRESGYPVSGVRIISEETGEHPFAPRVSAQGSQTKEDSLELLLVDWTFGTEELAAYSEDVQPVVPEPYLSMHPEDAARAQLSDGDTVVIQLEDGNSLEVVLRVSGKTAQGVLVLPRHWRLEWQKLKGLTRSVSLSQIRSRPDETAPVYATSSRS